MSSILTITPILTQKSSIPHSQKQIGRLCSAQERDRTFLGSYIAIMLTAFILVGCERASVVSAHSNLQTNGPVSQLMILDPSPSLPITSTPSIAPTPSITATISVTPTVLFDEQIDGELSSDPLAPNQFTLGLGTYVITMTSTSEDSDYFSLIVPDGMMVDSVTLNSYVVTAGDSSDVYLWIQDGVTYTNPAPSGDKIELVGTVLAVGDDEVGDVNLMNKMFTLGDGPCFKGPLLGEAYTIHAKKIGSSSTTYSLGLTVNQAPEKTHLPIIRTPANASRISAICSGIEWREEDLNVFSLLLPADMIEEEVQGTDSFVGQYNRAGMTLGFDYGWYSNPLNDHCDQPEYQESQIELSGKPARIISFRNEDQDFTPGYSYVAGLYVPNVFESESGAVDKLQADVQYNNAEEKAIARCILESVRFPE